MVPGAAELIVVVGKTLRATVVVVRKEPRYLCLSGLVVFVGTAEVILMMTHGNWVVLFIYSMTNMTHEKGSIARMCSHVSV